VQGVRATNETFALLPTDSKVLAASIAAGGGKAMLNTGGEPARKHHADRRQRDVGLAMIVDVCQSNERARTGIVWPPSSSQTQAFVLYQLV